jgi:hypothetical protein
MLRAVLEFKFVSRKIAAKQTMASWRCTGETAVRGDQATGAARRRQLNAQSP